MVLLLLRSHNIVQLGYNLLQYRMITLQLPVNLSELLDDKLNGLSTFEISHLYGLFKMQALLSPFAKLCTEVNIVTLELILIGDQSAHTLAVHAGLMFVVHSLLTLLFKKGAAFERHLLFQALVHIEPKTTVEHICMVLLSFH